MTNVYDDIIALIERLHRYSLDVLRAELRNLGIVDINSVQALLLSNIGTEEVVIRDLKDRGYYHGSNVSYNIKKLTETGYIEQKRSEQDRRAIYLKLTQKGLQLCDAVSKLNSYMADNIAKDAERLAKFTQSVEALEDLEKMYSDFIRYGKK